MLNHALRNILGETRAAIRRFPIPALCCLLFCAISLETFNFHSENARYLSILFCGCFWFIAVTLFAESRRWSVLKQYALGIPVFAGMTAGLYTTPEPMFPFWFLGGGLFCLMFIAPFLTREHWQGERIWVFSYHLWARIFFTLLAALVLFLGAIAIISSLKYLFGLPVPHDIYGDIWLTVATLFSPLLAMSGIPRRFDETEAAFPKPDRLILSYIAIPLLLVYALILHCYAAKIALIRDLPEGEIGWLVTAYACAGIAVWLASYSLRRSGGVIGFFHRRFFLLLPVPLALLAVGISVRIHAYGFTEERYALVVCLLWLLICAAAHMARIRNVPGMIILSLSILLMASSFGPWGAVAVSERSQVARLIVLLEKHHILTDGKIAPAKDTLSGQERSEISAQVHYLVRTKKLEHLRQWFAAMPDAHIHVDTRYFDVNRVMKDMGVRYSYPYRRDVRAFDFNSEILWRKPVVPVSGYDFMVNVPPFYSQTMKTNAMPQHMTLESDGGEIKLIVSYDPDEMIYRVTREDTGEVIAFMLRDILKEVEHKGADMYDYSRNGPILLFREGESETLKIRFIVSSLNGTFAHAEQKAHISSLGTVLLIKVKGGEKMTH